MSNHRRVGAARRPWVLALIVILLVTGLSLVVQSDLPFVGAGAPTQIAGPADKPGKIVSSTRF